MMYTRNANNSAVIESAINLTEQRDEDNAYRTLLHAIVGQAVEDATAPMPHPKWVTRDCYWTPDEAMVALKYMLGDKHAIVKRAEELRREGKRVHVNLHYQDCREGKISLV